MIKKKKGKDHPPSHNHTIDIVKYNDAPMKRKHKQPKEMTTTQKREEKKYILLLLL